MKNLPHMGSLNWHCYQLHPNCSIQPLHSFAEVLVSQMVLVWVLELAYVKLQLIEEKKIVKWSLETFFNRNCEFVVFVVASFF